MKLSLIPGHEATSKVQFNWKATTVEKLQQYVAFYKSVTGVEVTLKDLTEQMLVDFMNDDKAFQRFLKNGETPAAPAQAPAASAAAPRPAFSSQASSGASAAAEA